MQKPLILLIAPIRQFPSLLRTVQHDCRAKHIGLHKHFRVADAPVHMALRRKMHYPVNLVFGKDL